MCGYLVYIKSRLTVVFYKKFVRTISLLSFSGITKKIKPFLDLHFLKINVLLDVGYNDDVFKVLKILLPAKLILNNIYSILKNKKPYLKTYSNFNVSKDYDFDLHINVKAVVNILTVIINLTLILMEKIKNVFTGKQNKQNN